MQSQVDTVHLDEVLVAANEPSRYIPGGKQLKFRSDTVSLQNLAQALQSQMPVYFVQYGAPGQLSSINLRGMGAARTSLRWNGMEINSFTLGQTDYSFISAESVDLIKVQFGGVGAMYGNGALGGTIDISSQPNHSPGHRIGFSNSIGSFGLWGASLEYGYSTKKFSTRTRVFRRQSQNDFKYQLDETDHRQSNAGFRHYGLVQDIYYRANDRNHFSLHFWHNDYQREVQPNKSDFNGDDQLENRNTRIALSWKWNRGKWFGKVQTGYSRDLQLYNLVDEISVDRWFGSFETEWERSDKLALIIGGNLNYLIPMVNAYQDNNSEVRSDLYAGSIWKPLPRLTIGFSVRTPMANGDVKSFSPLLSAEYNLIHTPENQLVVDFQASHSYRLPTLNDLYWNPGGNPDLSAESSRNVEAGISYQLKRSSINWKTELRGFRHHVDDWILWVPGGREETPEGEILSFWYPDNIRQVVATGLEYQQSVQYSFQKVGLKTVLDIRGVYNQAVNQNAISPVDRSEGKQLPYTPLHIVNGNWGWHYESWSLSLGPQYISKRYLETNNELPPLPDYMLWNFGISKLGKIGSWNWQLQFQLNNAFSESYETFENRAMPGRNYQVKLSINNF